MEPLSRTKADPVQGRARPSNGSSTDVRSLGEYRVLRLLGEGGMGSVHLAYHEPSDRQVALKILAEPLASNQIYLDRFRREARSGALLNHPSIVRCLGASQDERTGKHYLVLEYVEGITALAFVEQNGKLDVGDAVHIALDVARALEHAHSRNIIHRDIKPDNVLLTRTGISKLTDFGLAKRLDETSHLTGARVGFGTPFYMPYEQAVNAKQADGRSDIYALGATLYHLLTGEVPFKGDSPLEVVESKDRGEFVPAVQINPAVPRLLDQIIARMLARRPEDRYQTASELIVDLERSRLAAGVPSYADAEEALRDPWVRACLATSGQPTQPDLSQAGVKTPPQDDADDAPPEWIVRYLTREGRWKRIRVVESQIVERLRDGRLPADSEVCRSPREGFMPAAEHPAFSRALAALRAARVRPKKQEPTPRRLSPLVLAFASLLLLCGVALACVLFTLGPGK